MGTAEPVSRHVVVHGRVQGVFFRDSVRDGAEAEGVGGWVQNRSDGAVEALFTGSPEAVDAMIDFCRSGPSRADVDEVEVDEPGGEADVPGEGFEVR